MENKDLTTSKFYYFIPFKQKTIEQGVDKLVLDNGLVFLKDTKKPRNLIRTDIKRCVENLEVFKLKKGKNRTFQINSYQLERDDNNKLTNYFIRTNLFQALILDEVSIIRFDAENQFLLLTCFINYDTTSKDCFDSEKIIRAHSNFFRNYHNEVRDDMILKEDAPLYDVLGEDGQFEGFITIGLDNVEFSLGKSTKSISHLLKCTIDFSNFPMQFLALSLSVIETEKDALNFIQKISNGSRKPHKNQEFDKSYFLENTISYFNQYGCSIICYRRPNDGAQIGDFEYCPNDRFFLKGFYREMITDFILGINYQNRIKKQIMRIGEINYNKDEFKYQSIKKEINTYYRESSFYFFSVVSHFSFINQWYEKLLEGLNIYSLSNELETKLKATNAYIEFKEEESNEIRKNNVEKIAFIFSTVVGTVLAILSYLQVIFQLPASNKFLFAVIGIIIIILSGIIGCSVILYLRKKANGH